MRYDKNNNNNEKPLKIKKSTEILKTVWVSYLKKLT